jgi:pathogenesis-related protein 1
MGDERNQGVKLRFRSVIFLAGALLLQGDLLYGAQKTGAASSTAKSKPANYRLSPEDAKKMLRLHNQVRAEVGVGPLRWSENLADYAQRWADHLAATRCGLEHRPRSGKWRAEFGENLFMGTLGYYGVADAVMGWAEEKELYPGGPYQAGWRGVGHYTQMVWRNTRTVGCATSVCKGNLVVVCNYDPPGNYIGEYVY